MFQQNLMLYSYLCFIENIDCPRSVSICLYCEMNPKLRIFFDKSGNHEVLAVKIAIPQPFFLSICLQLLLQA